MSFNKLGARFKRKSLLKKEEENMILREKLDKLKNICFVKDFIKIKIIKMWKSYYYKKKRTNNIKILLSR